MSHTCQKKSTKFKETVGCVPCYVAGIDAEQQRIVNLLKSLSTCKDNSHHWESCLCEEIILIEKGHDA